MIPKKQYLLRFFIEQQVIETYLEPTFYHMDDCLKRHWVIGAKARIDIVTVKEKGKDFPLIKTYGYIESYDQAEILGFLYKYHQWFLDNRRME